MRALRASLLLFVALAAASAADLKVKVIDLKVKVIDPQSAAVAGAHVSLFAKGTDSPLNVATTSAEGIVTFGELSSGSYQDSSPGSGFRFTDRRRRRSFRCHHDPAAPRHCI